MQQKLIEWQTKLVDLSNAADKARHPVPTLPRARAAGGGGGSIRARAAGARVYAAARGATARAVGGDAACRPSHSPPPPGRGAGETRPLRPPRARSLFGLEREKCAS